MAVAVVVAVAAACGAKTYTAKTSPKHLAAPQHPSTPQHPPVPAPIRPKWLNTTDIRPPCLVWMRGKLNRVLCGWCVDEEQDKST
ncbi:hypothetical protein E2C01_102525 [Portunus trituberculatus]|uniref:Uncharacterized protein n=1 Tax=Portunus trituberculatus TaxID=210409 RepID=A0A5B7KCU8_PORTR|nr:hypothetical protein [Portunus trituberculatus]